MDRCYFAWEKESASRAVTERRKPSTEEDGQEEGRLGRTKRTRYFVSELVGRTGKKGTKSGPFIAEGWGPLWILI